MKHYYRFTTYTPFVGEDVDYYDCIDDEEVINVDTIIIEKSDNYAWDNANEWLNDELLIESDMTEEEYYSDCGCNVQEISEDEYKECVYGS